MKAILFLAISMASIARAELRVGVATASKLKVAAVHAALEEVFPKGKYVIYAFKAPSGVAEQPVMLTWGLKGAKNRLNSAKAAVQETVDLWISMENFIEPTASSEKWRDIAAVVVERSKDSQVAVEFSAAVELPAKFARLARETSKEIEESGWSVTAGEMIHAEYKQAGIDVPKDDWHAHKDFGGKSRQDILAETIAKALRQLPADSCEKIAAGT